MKAKVKSAFYGFFEALLPSGQVRLTDGLRQRLVANPLTVIDVGAVFGPTRAGSSSANAPVAS